MREPKLGVFEGCSPKDAVLEVASNEDVEVDVVAEVDACDENRPCGVAVTAVFGGPVRIYEDTFTLPPPLEVATSMSIGTPGGAAFVIVCSWTTPLLSVSM